LTNKNNRTLQDAFKDSNPYEHERNGIHNETITSVVDINFEGDNNTSINHVNSISNNIRYGN
jgi:hypothetical protein